MPGQSGGAMTMPRPGGVGLPEMRGVRGRCAIHIHGAAQTGQFGRHQQKRRDHSQHHQLPIISHIWPGNSGGERRAGVAPAAIFIAAAKADA